MSTEPRDHPHLEIAGAFNLSEASGVSSVQENEDWQTDPAEGFIVVGTQADFSLDAAAGAGKNIEIINRGIPLEVVQMAMYVSTSSAAYRATGPNLDPLQGVNWQKALVRRGFSTHSGTDAGRHSVQHTFEVPYRLEPNDSVFHGWNIDNEEGTAITPKVASHVFLRPAESAGV